MSGNHDQDHIVIKGGAPQATLRTALDAFQNDDLKRAALLARSVAEEAPQQEDAWRIMAAVAQRQGRMSAAADALRDGIARNPNSFSLFTMLGLLLRDGGRLDDAETALRHALTLQPDTSEAALPLGNLLAQQGRLHDAEEIFRAAATRAPNDARFPLQIGRLMMTIGNDDLAKQAFEHAAQSSQVASSGSALQYPTVYVSAASHLGSILLREGKRPEALNWLYDAVTMGGDEAARNQFAECVASIPFAESQPLLRPLLVRAISGHWTNPSDLVRFSAQQLMYDPEFSSAAERIPVLESEDDAPLLSVEVAKVARDPLLRAMLENAVIPHAAFEDFLSSLRRMLLRARANPNATVARGAEGLLAFSVTLAKQCFLTEYAYAVSDTEAQIVAALDARIAAAVASQAPIALSDLATLAAYRPLHGLEYAKALSARDWAPAVKSLIRTQLREPQHEAALRATIPCITAIIDATSEAVRAQYEENPYPRWADTAVRTQPFALEQWVHGTFPYLPPEMITARDANIPLSILVAGCGTGQETIATATRFANSEVLAVDLSLSSLSYAMRKAEEIGLKNISYAQGDLLEMEGLGRQFDVIECAGVCTISGSACRLARTGQTNQTRRLYADGPVQRARPARSRCRNHLHCR